jgi:hypothetical protein
MKSLLFQTGTSVFTEPTDCAALPCRQEVRVNLRKNGRIYRFTLRDKILPDDYYLVLLKAAAFALQTSEPYNGTPPSRAVRDWLIKSNVVI